MCKEMATRIAVNFDRVRIIPFLVDHFYTHNYAVFTSINSVNVFLFTYKCIYIIIGQSWSGYIYYIFI